MSDPTAAPSPASPPVPADADAVDAAWFNEALAACGLARDARVVGVEHARIGAGLVGANLRCRLRWDRSDPALPTRLVVKLASPDPESRAAGVAMRIYEREVHFYRDIAPTVACRVPACYAATWDAASGSFVLLLEDLAPARPGDQLRGCSPEQASAAVRELARLHGPRWDDTSLAELDWLSRPNPKGAARIADLYRSLLDGFLDSYGDGLDAEQVDLTRRLGDGLDTWLAEAPEPYTVVHGDYRLDNLLFGEEDPSRRPGSATGVAIVDWQTPAFSAGPADLAYFVGGALDPPERRAAETGLVTEYRAELARFGVRLEADVLWETYRRYAVGGVVMTVLASSVVTTDRRGHAMFATLARRHLTHVQDMDATAFLPG